MSDGVISAELPDWRSPALGTRIKVALWLATEVGPGGKFTKQQLREAMPGVEQVDRRMRDLRPAGWIIDTYRDRPGLAGDELFLQKVGLPVWEKEHRAAGLRIISESIRRQVFERDGHRCIRCGVLANEEYADEPGKTARLTVGHVTPHKYGSGATVADLVTECARCNESVKQFTGPTLTEEQVWDRLAQLPKADKLKLLAWLVAGRREPTNVEKAAALVFQLPAVHRDEIKTRLARVLGEG